MQDLLVYLEVNVVHIPCEILDLRFVARKGTEHNVIRERLTAEGEMPFNSDRDLPEVLAAFDRREGCKIKGKFHKHFVLNSFVITLGNPPLLSRIIMERPGKPFDLSHYIVDFMLGDVSNRKYYEE